MLVYRKGEFVITKASDGFIVYNTTKEWEGGHSHLRSFKAAKTAINLVQKGKMPRSRGVLLSDDATEDCHRRGVHCPYRATEDDQETEGQETGVLQR